MEVDDNSKDWMYVNDVQLQGAVDYLLGKLNQRPGGLSPQLFPADSPTGHE